MKHRLLHGIAEPVRNSFHGPVSLLWNLARYLRLQPETVVLASDSELNKVAGRWIEREAKHTGVLERSPVTA